MTATKMFSLQFIRKITDKGQDDLAAIACIGVDKYKITYSDATIHNKMTFETNGYGVLRWIRRIMRLLEEDVDPFENLQLNLPAMPSTLFNISNLSENYTTILNAVEFYLDEISKPTEPSSLPSTPKTTPVHRECPPAPSRRHLFFDEDGNEDYRHPPLRELDFNY
jgi:hypothetical protein